MKKFNVVFEGGGVKGIGLVGALARVEEEHVELMGLAGTSAGAIVASLRAAGYSPEELKVVLRRMDFGSLLDPSWPKYYQLWSTYGIYKGQRIYEWLYVLLKEKGVTTFQDLGERELKVIASDVTNKEILTFDKRNNPTLKVAEAVRMSIGIPLVFQAYRWGEKLVVDGGLLSNYPIWAFADSRFPTLGFKLVSRVGGKAPIAPASLPSFLVSLVSTMLEAHDKEDERAIGWEQTIHIPTGNIGTMQFGLETKEKEELYDSGYHAASEYIRKSNFFREVEGMPSPAERDTLRPRMEVGIYESKDRILKMEAAVSESTFQISEASRKVFVISPDAELEAWENGINVSQSPQNEVVRFVVGDTPVDFRQLEFKAWFDSGDGKREAAVVPEASQDGRAYKVHIGFKGRVVQAGCSVRVEWKFKWPGAVARNEDYWVFPANYYVHPVGKLSIEAVFPHDPADLRFFAVGDAGVSPLDIAGPFLDKSEKQQTVYAYRTIIHSPKGVYLLRWRVETQSR